MRLPLNPTVPPSDLLKEGWSVHIRKWKFHLALTALFLPLIMASRGWWIPEVAWGLVAKPAAFKPDMILVDNLVTDYKLFEKARNLRKLETATTVLVPVRASDRDPDKPDPMGFQIARVMIRQARLQPCRILPFREVEPFTLNLARQVGEFLKSHPDIHSVLVVTQACRSRRTQLVYGKVLGKLGAKVSTYPVWNSDRAGNWAATWHGRQEVLLQYIKLIYYELYLYR